MQSLSPTQIHVPSLSPTHTNTHAKLCHSHKCTCHLCPPTQIHMQSLSPTHTNTHAISVTHWNAYAISVTHTNTHAISVTHSNTHAISVTHSNIDAISVTHTNAHAIYVTHTNTRAISVHPTQIHMKSLSPTQYTCHLCHPLKYACHLCHPKQIHMPSLKDHSFLTDLRPSHSPSPSFFRFMAFDARIWGAWPKSSIKLEMDLKSYCSVRVVTKYQYARSFRTGWISIHLDRGKPPWSKWNGQFFRPLFGTVKAESSWEQFCLMK